VIEKSDSVLVEAAGGEQELAPSKRELLYSYKYITNNFCPSYRHMLPFVFEARSS
jgi:hypothetical protein